MSTSIHIKLSVAPRGLACDRAKAAGAFTDQLEVLGGRDEFRRTLFAVFTKYDGKTKTETKAEIAV